jgi:hypothetical protein
LTIQTQNVNGVYLQKKTCGYSATLKVELKYLHDYAGINTITGLIAAGKVVSLIQHEWSPKSLIAIGEITLAT